MSCAKSAPSHAATRGGCRHSRARCVLPGSACPVTQRGTDRQRLFLTDSDHRSYLRALRANRENARVRLLACWLMDNHIHLALIPEREDPLAALMHPALAYVERNPL